MPIKKVKEIADKAYAQLKKYQSGELQPIKTGREWLDEIFGGLLPMDIVTIAGMSGGGKSFELQRIKNYVMDEANNPQAAKFVWLDHSLEMRFISNIIRDLNQKLKKTKKKILSEIFSEEEKQLVRDYYNTTTDSRYFINEEAVVPSQFEQEMIEFLEAHKEAEAVFVSIDHIALQKDKNGDKKATVDEIVEIINRLKKRYTNSFWFLLSQLNRNILARIREKDINAMPNRGDVFQSDSMFFISDYLYVCHNPHRLGIGQFSKVNAEIYDYLAEHFIEEKKGKASFDTLGKIFYIVLKMREADIMYKDIYIEEIEIENRDKYREPVDDELLPEPGFTPRRIDLTQPKEENYSITDVSTPKFEPRTDLWDTHEMETGMASEEDEDDSPFK